MAKSPVTLQGFAQAFSTNTPDTVYLPKIAAPFSTVTNRAKVTDFSNDLLPRFGVERIMIQQAQLVPNEFGANGESVFKPINDVHDQVRLIGSWSSSISSLGQYVISGSNLTDLLEITFYGTGCNILLYADPTRQMAAKVDGGAEGSNIIPASSNNLIAGRNYSANTVYPVTVTSGLTLGLHTVTFRTTGGPGNGAIIQGFEILNTNSTLQLPPGASFARGKKLVKSTLTTDAHNSGFESGTLGTRGGHVVVYQKADSTIGKAVTPTDTVAGYLTSASHANEEIIRNYHFREFGAGRSDDFSLPVASAGGSGTTARAFTLDDGTTTLVTGPTSTFFNPGTGESIVPNTTNDFITLTFVGSGLDVQAIRTIATDPHSVLIDGNSVGNLTSSIQGAMKIASGLPYGTHTVKIARNSIISGSLALSNFIVYGPKKPAIPSGAIELADYFLMADYIQNTTAGIEYISQGVLRKHIVRENVYVGAGWQLNSSIQPTVIGGMYAYTNASTQYFESTFFGTGFEIRGQASTTYSSNISVSLAQNGGSLLSATTGNFATLTSGNYGGYSFSGGTMSEAVSNTLGSGVAFKTLPLSVWKARFTDNAAANMLVEAIDIITPVHSPKGNLPGDLQNTLPVGSCAIGDNRKFGGQAVKPLANWAQAVGVSNTPTTTSAIFIPLADMSCTVKTNGNPIEVWAVASLYSSAVGPGLELALFVDGVQFANTISAASAGINIAVPVSISAIIPVSAGVHKIDIYWATGSGTMSTSSTRRILKVREI